MMSAYTVKKAALFSLILGALVIGIGMYSTDVIFAGKITPAEDEAISLKFGFALGIGLVLFWLPFYVRWLKGVRERFLQSRK